MRDSGDSCSTESTAVDVELPLYHMIGDLDNGLETDDDFSVVNTRVLFSNPDFIYILANASSDNFGFHRYCNSTVYGLMPTVPEVTAHLKLLAAFDAYKRSVVGDDDELPIKEKLWQVHVSNLVRRFVMFVTGLMKRFEIPINPKFDLREDVQFDDAVERDHLDGFVHLMLNILPPLDVIMVWHAFMLQPRLYYDHFARNQFVKFALLPLPLNMIADAIDNLLFVYNPRQQLRDNYLEIIEQVGAHPADFLYDVDANDVMGMLVDVHCPICESLIFERVPLTNDENTGFADRDFSMEMPSKLGCGHKITTPITHSELQKRMVYADALKRRPFAGLFKYFSMKICHDKKKGSRLEATQRQLQKRISKMVLLPQFTRKSNLVDFMKHELPRFCEKPVITILRTYLQLNPLHLTVPNLFIVWDDLVGAVLRQERFTKKMQIMDWLHNQLLKKTLAELIIRYTRFLNLLIRNDHQRMLVPTLDIDLVWHTHQLSPYYYYQECMNSPMGGIIDHDDKVEEVRIDLGFKDTATLYYSKFKEPYLVCFCPYCLLVRHSLQQKPVILGIGKTSAKVAQRDEMELMHHPLFLSQTVGYTHISLHNAISMPTYSARQARKHLLARNKNSLPWSELLATVGSDTILKASGNHTICPMQGDELYVFPPNAPFHFDSRHFYEGLCCTIRDMGPNCSGVSGCSGGSDGGNGQRIV